MPDEADADKILTASPPGVLRGYHWDVIA